MTVVLHPTTENQLQQFSEHPPHAILITGPAGSGKRSVAFLLAARALGRSEDTIESYPRLTVIEPDNGSISIDAIRNLQHTLSLKGGSSDERRIALIIDSHTLGEEAQNALLKTLEEPPAGAIIILTSSNATSLLPTVRSRTQELAVYPPAADALVAHFTETGHTGEAITKAQRLSGGLPGLMQALLSEDTTHPLYEATTTAREIIQKDTYNRLLLVDALAKNKQRCLDICFVLGQMADIALQSARNSAQQRGWQRVLQASYDARTAFDTNAGTKLIMTNLMLSL